jgi:hypothetical protein
LISDRSACSAAKFVEKWRMADVSCSFVIVGRLYDDPAVGRPSVEVRASVATLEGGAVCGVVAGGAVAMEAGGSKVSSTKLVGLRILPGISLSL